MSTDTANVLEIITNSIISKNKTLNVKPNSVFAALELNPNSIASIANDISSKIAGELSLVKGKLKPLMEDIVKLIEDKLSSYQGDNELTNYKIETINFPKLLEELKISKVIATRRDPINIGMKPVSIPTPDNIKLREYFQSTNANINLYAQELVKKYSDEMLSNLWDKYISVISDSNPNIRDMGLYAYDNIEDLLLLYIALSKLVDTKPENTECSDTVYFDVVNLYYQEVLNYISIVYDKIESGRKINKVVMKIEDTVATVDEEIYKKFIDEGNAPDVILGLILSGKRDYIDYTIEALKTNSENYSKLWDSKVKLFKYNSLNNEVNRYKTVYSILLPEIYDNNIPNDLREYLLVDFDQCNILMTELLDSMTSAEVIDIHLFAKELVGQVLFPNTSFNYFATTMADYAKSNPEFTPEDAATFASLDYIIDFMLDQLYLGDIDGNPAN